MRRIVSATGWLGVAGVVVYMVWGTVTYSGLYRWLAEWQIAAWGSYSIGLTCAGPMLVLMSPFAIIATVAGMSDGGPDQSARARARRGRTAALVLLALAAAGFGFGGWMIDRGIHAPSMDDPLQTVDLAASGDAPLPEGHVRLLGQRDDAAAVRRRERMRSGEKETTFTPIRARGAAVGAPIRVVAVDWALDPKPQPPLWQGAGRDPEGMLVPDALSGEGRVMLERSGVVLAPRVFVLNSSAMDRTGSDYVWGGAGVLVGLFFGVAGLVYLARPAAFKLV